MDNCILKSFGGAGLNRRAEPQGWGWGAALAGLLVLAGPTALAAADQPQWGERFTRNQVSPEKNLPELFDPKTGRHVKWTAELGTQTHSTPVVAGGRVLIGTNNGRSRNPKQRGDRGVLMCFDEQTGRFCWELLVPKRGPSMFWDWPNAGICSPATVEGRRVYVVSNRGEVMCLDLDGLANGNDGPFQDESRHATPAGQEPPPLSETDADILWLYDYTKEVGVRQHDSAHSSILMHGPYLYVNTSNGVDDSHRKIDAPDAPSLIVLDKTTGRLVATDGEHIGPRIFHSTWSSPALGEVEGRTLVFFCGGDGVVYAFEPLPWTRQGDRAVPAPVPGAEGKAVPTLQRVWRFDCDPGAPKESVHQYNSNRKVSPSNIKSMPVFHDGRLYVTVGGDLWWGKNEAWLKCFSAQGQGDLTSSALRWSYPLERHSMSTPAVSGELVFAADCGRKLHCVDARSGGVCWTHELRGEIWASPLVADGKVYLGTRNGEFIVLAATREKKVLSDVDLDSPISGTAVAANGVLYVTTQTQLHALEQKD